MVRTWQSDCELKSGIVIVVETTQLQLAKLERISHRVN